MGLFKLGQLVATPAALEALEEAGQTPMDYIKRHSAGDWGDLDDDDIKTNEDALKHGGRLFSAYDLSTGIRLWVISEEDGSATTVLLPSDY